MSIGERLSAALERDRLRKERDKARACARVLAHSYVHDSRPPQVEGERAMAYPIRPAG